MTLKRMTDSGRLVDVTPLARETFNTGAELVPVGPDCPDCGEPLQRVWVKQDSLIRGGGYGGTKRVETDQCRGCFFQRVVAVATERPPR